MDNEYGYIEWWEPVPIKHEIISLKPSSVLDEDERGEWIS